MGSYTTLIILAVTVALVQTHVNYNGTWYNQLGSTMMLTAELNGALFGNFTTVLQQPPVMSSSMTGLFGTAANNTVSTFGFVARWGSSYVGSWNGEYKVCQGVHVLISNFILKPPTNSCVESRLSLRTGEECFTRFRQVPLSGEQCAANQYNPCNSPC